MAGSIKGLTVEIGGDTTKLGKALEGVQKKSKSLSGELGQINRLLKLDPGNTDLLSQKQRVLAEAIENTAAKLDTLKEAEKQVQKQFERGEVSEEQVRALQREIIATEKKMDSYKNAAKETEQALRGVGDESKKTEKESGKLGTTLATAAKTGFAAIAAVAAAAVAGLTAAAESTREYRTEMGKLNAAFTASEHNTQTAATAYKTLFGIIGETDQSVEAAQQIALLADSEKEVAQWADLAAGVVGRFGDALQPETFFEAANETLKLGESTGAFTQMLEGCGINVEDFNEKLAACSTTEERQAYLLQVTEGALGAAGEAYKKNNADIIEANKANDNWMQSLAGIGGAIEPIITDVKNLGASLLGDAVPGVKQLADAFRGLMSGDAGASGDFASALSGLVSGLVEKITQALPTIASVGFNIISTLATSLLQQIPLLLTTAGQIVTQLVHAITTHLPTVVSKGAEFLGKLGEGIKNAMPGLIDRGLEIISGLVDSLYNAAPRLIDAGFGFIKNLVAGLVSSLPTLIAKAPEIITKFANILNDNVPRILKHGFDIIVQLVKGIITAIPTLIANIPKIFEAFMAVWEAFNWVNLGKKAITLLKTGIDLMKTAVKNAGTNVLNAITSALQALPGKLLTLGKNAINFLKNGITGMIGSVRAAGSNVLSAVVNAITGLPRRLLSLGRNAITSLGSAISSGVSSLKSKAVQLFNSIVDAAKEIPGRMIQVGKDIINGVISGISSMVGALYNSIKDALGGLVDKAKDALGINSPSKVFANTVGVAIPEGIEKGLNDNAKIATNAVGNLSRDLVDAAETDVGGLTFERNLQYNARAAVTPAGLVGAAAMDNAALLAKLDGIYERLGRLQVVLDSGATVGGLIDQIDRALATRQVLASRGV
jgi:phage-related protein